MSNSPQIELLRYELHKRETAAKAVPYVSFILIHVALALFLVLSFFIDRILGPSPAILPVKIILTALAVAFLASEWIYAIVNSRRWKRDILLLLQLEQQHQQREEQEKLKRQEDLIAAEQFKNRLLQADLQRQRAMNGALAASSYTVRSVRPPQYLLPPSQVGNPPSSPVGNMYNGQLPSSPDNSIGDMQFPFAPSPNTPPPLPYPPMNPNATRSPFR